MAPGIGAGFRKSCGSIFIEGGTINAVGGAGCAAIGAALQASCDSIVIANTVTSVTATKLDDAPCCIGIADEGSQNLPTPRAPVESP